MKVWAVIWPDGSVLADSTFRNAAHAWRVALGWPDDKEIAIAKRKGYRAERVTITAAPTPEVEPDPTEREIQHLLRCAIALVARKGLSEVAGESRAVIAHKLQLMLAEPFPSEVEPVGEVAEVLFERVGPFIIGSLTKEGRSLPPGTKLYTLSPAVAEESRRDAIAKLYPRECLMDSLHAAAERYEP